DHFIRRTLPAVDLTDFSELRLWFRATVPASGTADQPFRLQTRLGSAALPIGAVGNDWHRYLPAFGGSRWQFARMSLDDLDPQVAAAVDTIQFTVVNTTTSWVGWLDHLIACRPQLIEDVHTALETLLSGGLDIGGP